MYKVKCFHGNNAKDLETSINQWLKDKLINIGQMTQSEDAASVHVTILYSEIQSEED